MRKVILSSLFAAIALLATSCVKSDKSPSYTYTYAVVESSTSKGIDFMLDDDKTLTIVENLSTVKYTDLSYGDRAIIGIATLPKDSSSSYDYQAQLYEVIDVVTGTSYTFIDESEQEEIFDNELYSIGSSMTLTYGYLNLVAQFSTKASEGLFYLVENPFMESLNDDSDYLNLQLRFTGDSSATSPAQYVSFNMEYFREQLEGKKGVALHFNTKVSDGESVLKIKANDLFEE